MRRILVALWLLWSHAALARTFALVLGNNVAPGTELTELRYADDDAIMLAELLRSSGVETSLLVVADHDTAQRFGATLPQANPPTHQNVRHALRALFRQIEEDNAQAHETHFYVAYSGHGDVVRGNEGRIFLHDGALTRGELLRDIVGRSPATYNHVVIDACHAYFMVQPKGKKATRSFDEVLKAYLDAETLAGHPNTGVMVSTSSRAEVHEWAALGGGLFSHQVRSALAGGADADGDGRISYLEMGAFFAAANAGIADVNTQVVAYVRAPSVSDQVPLFDLRGHEPMLALSDGAGLLRLVDDRGVPHVSMQKASDTSLALALLPHRRYDVQLGDRYGEVFTDGPLRSALAVTWNHAPTPQPVLLAGLFQTPFDAHFVRGYGAAQRGASARNDSRTEVSRIGVVLLSDATISAAVLATLWDQLVDLVRDGGGTAVRLTDSEHAWRGVLEGQAAPVREQDVGVERIWLLQLSAQEQGKVRQSQLDSVRVTLGSHVLAHGGHESQRFEAVGLGLGSLVATQRALEQVLGQASEQLYH